MRPFRFIIATLLLVNATKAMENPPPAWSILPDPRSAPAPIIPLVDGLEPVVRDVRHHFILSLLPLEALANYARCSKACHAEVRSVFLKWLLINPMVSRIFEQLPPNTDKDDEDLAHEYVLKVSESAKAYGLPQQIMDFIERLLQTPDNAILILGAVQTRTHFSQLLLTPCSRFARVSRLQLQLESTISVLPPLCRLFPSLSSLYLGGTRLRIIDLDRTLQLIETLNLDGCQNLLAVPALLKLPSLRDLYLCNCDGITEIDLTNNHHLQVIVLQNCRNLRDLRGLAGLNHLAYFDVRGCLNLSPETRANIEQIKKTQLGARIILD